MEEISASIAKSVEAIEKVAKESKGLKGTLSKALKIASIQIRTLMDEMSFLVYLRNSGEPVARGPVDAN